MMKPIYHTWPRGWGLQVAKHLQVAKQCQNSFPNFDLSFFSPIIFNPHVPNSLHTVLQNVKHFSFQFLLILLFFKKKTKVHFWGLCVSAPDLCSLFSSPENILQSVVPISLSLWVLLQFSQEELISIVFLMHLWYYAYYFISKLFTFFPLLLYH